MNVSAISSSANLASARADAATLSRLPEAAQVKAAAGQFEAVLLRQLLQESVGKLTGGEKSGGAGMYGFLLTDVLANRIAESGGLGLGRVISQQLGRPGAAVPSSKTPSP